MARRLRRLFALLAALALLVGSAAPAAGSPTKESTSEIDPAADAVLLRPFGILATVIGTGVFLGQAPVYLVTRPHEIDEPFRTFVADPAVWTWGRPLGEK